MQKIDCVGPVDLCWKLIASPIWYWSQYSRRTIPVDNIKERNSKQNHTTDMLLWMYDTYVLYGVDLGNLRGCEERHFTSTLHRFEDSLNDLTARSTRWTEVYKPTKDTRPCCSRYFPIVYLSAHRLKHCCSLTQAELTTGSTSIKPAMTSKVRLKNNNKSLMHSCQ